MNIFDDLIKFDQNGNFSYNQWIEWNHFLIPNKPKLLRKMMRKLMAFYNHCVKCTALDGCYLLDNNKPAQPLHPHCDCNKISISSKKLSENANAELTNSKLTNYIFAGKIQSKGK